MNAHKQKAALFCICATYYGRELSDDVAELYAEDVADLSVELVRHAMNQLRRDPKRRHLPLPAEIREALTPPTIRQSPELIAGRIAGAVSKFGRPNAARARAYVGEIGWRVVEIMGGWSDLCSRLQSAHVGTFTAQAREMCRAELATDEQAASFAALPQAAPQRRLAAMTQQIGSW